MFSSIERRPLHSMIAAQYSVLTASRAWGSRSSLHIGSRSTRHSAFLSPVRNALHSNDLQTPRPVGTRPDSGADILRRR